MKDLNKWKIGLDVGSTTVKLVVLDELNNMVFQDYQRHFSDVRSTVHKLLETLGKRFPSAVMTIAVTGSSGMTTSAQLNVPFVQEVIACSEAVRYRAPDTDVAIELGGEDAKITYFGDTPELRMNGTCAGGTGAFIDQMAVLLKTDAQGLDALAEKHKEIYPIASRCGVFAKTDVQPLLNEGAAQEDIAASIFQAVVNQTIAGLACGKPIRGKVAFLGGPLCFLPQLRQRFIETLRLAPEDIIFPENAQLFVALGAALISQAKAEGSAAGGEQAKGPSVWLTMSDLMSRLDNLHNSESEGSHLEPLFESEEAYEAFTERHSSGCVVRRELSQAAGVCFLGIDAGSTTTKLALIDEEGALLYSHYGSNDGSPLRSTVKALRHMSAAMPDNLKVGRAVVTGYGEALLKTALQIDHGEIETVAHLKGADYFLPGVDFILDIGGQDMKCMQISDGVINNIMLNEACSSGCGSFIETLAKSLGLSIEEFVQKGIYAAPVDLGTRCTVFMNSKIKQVQKEGADIGSIAAGIAYSVVKNALYKVIRLNSVAQVGEKIVVQGGTFYNDAVLRSFEKITGHEVVRPDIAGIMGAFGAALIAKGGHTAGAETGMLLGDELEGFRADSVTRYCGLCGNNCLLTVNTFPGGRELVTGNRCERGSGVESAAAEEIPNLFDYKYKRLFAYTPLAKEAAPRGEIGLPRGLNMYEHYPFWFTFFTELGFRVVLSGRSSKKIFELGMETVSSESICYPAKLINGHVLDLVRRGVKTIFYPCLPRDEKEDPNSNNNFNCPVVTSYPQSIQANVDALSREDMTFLYPFLPMDNMDRLKDRLAEELLCLGLKKDEIGGAVDKAYAERLAFRADIRAKGEEVLKWLEQTQNKGIILAGRPYHIDPEINHGIPEMITGYGMAVLTEDSVAHLGQTPRPLRVLDQWMYHSRLYAAASLTTTRNDLELVQLNSFGCGLDAVTIDQVHELLEQYRKTYTLIKIDEINNLGAVRIRIRSLLAAMQERKEKGIVAEKRHELPERRVFTEEMRATHTILCPQMSPIQFAVLEEALRIEGYNIQILPDVAMDVVEQGLLHVHNDACYPTIIVVGQIMAALKSGAYDLDKTAVIMSQTGGGCRASNYVGFIRKALKDAGMEQIPVISLNALGWEKNPGWTMSFRMIKRAVMACIYGDLLMRLSMAVRPYEKVPGSANALLEKWIGLTRQAVADLKKGPFKANIRQIIRDFAALEVHDIEKPKVGVVGEILVKFHPFANNYIVDVLEREGAEAVMPDLMDFLLYCLYNSIYNAKKLSATKKQSLINRYLIWHMELYRSFMKKELKRSRFSEPKSIYHKAKLAQKVVHLGHQTGEGWFLTGEMLELLESGTSNIACLQPFGCLPNHIMGKGIMRELKRHHPEANIVAIDYDPGASHVNQLNRIKLMLSVAFEKMGSSHQGATVETLPDTLPTPPLCSESDCQVS